MSRNSIFVFFLLLACSCSPLADKRKTIDAGKLSDLISNKERTLVYVWTTWCSGCRETLSETLPKIHQELDSSQYQILLIAASKNTSEVDSLVTVDALKKNSYLLDFAGPDKGFFQNLGIRFMLEKCFPSDEIFTGGIPVFFMVDKNRNVLHKKIPHPYHEAIRTLRK